MIRSHLINHIAQGHPISRYSTFAQAFCLSTIHDSFMINSNDTVITNDSETNNVNSNDNDK